MGPAPSRRRSKILSSVVGGAIWGATIAQSGLLSGDKRWSAASLAWRGVANGLLFALLLYFLLGPLVDRIRARRRVGLTDILAFCGCFGLLGACWWFAVRP